MQTADLASAGVATSTRAFLQDAILLGLECGLYEKKGKFMYLSAGRTLAYLKPVCLSIQRQVCLPLRMSAGIVFQSPLVLPAVFRS